MGTVLGMGTVRSMSTTMTTDVCGRVSVASSGLVYVPGQPVPVPLRYDLLALNQAYTTLLTERRQRANHAAPAVRFDRNLLAGTLLHNRSMEVADTLYHAATPNAELVGTLLEDAPRDPRELALHIYNRLDRSPGHARLQSDPRLVWVSISATRSYFTVRLSSVPAPPGG